MDMDKIFLKDACPTSIGGQAVIEGIMMRGVKKVALAVRTGDNEIHLVTRHNRAVSKAAKVPILRGVIALWYSMLDGTKTLMESASILEATDYYDEEPSAVDAWMKKHFGEKGAFRITIYLSVVMALIFSVGIFVLLPTWIVDSLHSYVNGNKVLLSLAEGILRLIIFIGYLLVIARMKDIKRVFQYHGAEHKTIHCFEQGLELTPDNAQSFYTLHPRCGTSFLMFVMILTVLLFPLMGWPSIFMRFLSRIVLIPIIAGISFELIKWAGRSNSKVVELLSLPGIYLQKITTNEPDESQLQVAIVAMKAVLPEEDQAPLFCGKVDNNGCKLTIEEELEL